MHFSHAYYGFLCLQAKKIRGGRKKRTSNVASFYAQVDNSGVAGLRDTFDPTNNRIASILLRVPESMSEGKHTITITFSSSAIENDPNARKVSRTKEFTVTRDKGIDLAWPTPNYKSVSSHYGNRQHPILIDRLPHEGIDISGGGIDKTPIYAAADGTVIFAGWNGGYGNCVKIQHAEGIITLYGHMSSILVSKDIKVRKGDQIGTVGTTGRSTGPHLHFNVYNNGNLDDPLSGYFNSTITEEVYDATLAYFRGTDYPNGGLVDFG